MMDDTTLEQRIKYLVEHGGVWDDPLADIRRIAKWAMVVACISLALNAVDLLI